MFEYMNLKFGTLENSVQKMTHEVKKVSDRVSRLDDKVNKLDDKVNRLDDKVSRLDAKLDQVSQDIQKQPLQAPQIQPPQPNVLPEQRALNQDFMQMQIQEQQPILQIDEQRNFVAPLMDFDNIQISKWDKKQTLAEFVMESQLFFDEKLELLEDIERIGNAQIEDSEKHCLYLNRAPQVFKNVQFQKLGESDFFMTVKLQTSNFDSEVFGFFSEVGEDKGRNLFIPYNQQNRFQLEDKLSGEDYVTFIDNLIELQRNNIPLFFYARESQELQKIELKVLRQRERMAALKDKTDIQIPTVLSLGDMDFWVPEKRIFAFELSKTTVVRQFVQGSFQLHNTEISEFILTGSLSGYSIAIRLNSSSLATNRIQPDEFCEK